MQDIRKLEHRATKLADRIGKKLEQGIGATALLEDIQEQVEVVNTLQDEIRALSESPDGRLSAVSLERLKGTFKALVERVEGNVQAASRKGVRITPQAHSANRPTP
jgi:uncharacterized protein YoxC